MTRTKQTKPRHIVEDGEKSEDPMPVCINEEKDLIVDVETSEENDKVLSTTNSEKWMSCSTNVSPSDCNSFEGDASHPLLPIGNFNSPSDAYDLLHKDDSEVNDSAGDINNADPFHSERLWKEENETTQENQLSPGHSYNQLQTYNQVPPAESASVLSDSNVEVAGISDRSETISNSQSTIGERNYKDITDNEEVPNSSTSANVEEEKIAHLYQSDPVQQHLASLATAHYMNAIKMFVDNGTVSHPSDGNTEAWSAWASSARNVIQQNGANANSSSLVNRYVAQLTETWNNMMMQQFSSQGQLRYHPYHANRSKQASPYEQGNETPESSYGKNYSDNTSSPMTSNRISPPLSEKGPSRKASDIQLPQNEDFSKNTPGEVHSISVKNNDTALDILDMPNEKNIASKNSCLGRQAPSPLTIPKFPNPGVFQQTTPLSAPALGNNKYLDLSLNSFHYRPWSTSSWLGYRSPQLNRSPLANFSDHFSHPRHTSSKSSQFEPLLKTQNKPSSLAQQKIRNDIHRKTSLSSKRSDISCNNSFPHFSPAISGNAALQHNISPRRKFSDPTAFLKNADYHNSQFLEEIRHQYKLSHPSFNSPWLNAGLSPNTITSPKFPAMHSLASNKSNPQMFFPSGMHLMSPTPGYPLTTSLPQTERPSFQGNVPYKPENVLPLSPSAGKVGSSRRSRSRGGPLDSVHAAIVREAKEQFKGLDPENMYIQCPICHKRIKRLYHFQRHMRIHTGEKSHQCPCCQYKSVRKDNLKSHMKTHEKQSIENGRKMSKANFQTNRNSEGMNEKIHARGSGGTHENKPTDFPKSADSSLTSLPESRKSMKSFPTEMSQDNVSFPAPKKEPTNNKRSFPTSYPLNYQMPFIKSPHATKTNEGFRNLSLPSPEGEHSNTSSHHQKTQNGDRFMEDRATQFGQADFASSSPGNKFKKSSDKFSEQLKRNYSGLEVPQDLSIGNDCGEIPKKQKLLKTETYAPKNKMSYFQSDEMNINNNNDSNREGLPMISKPPYFPNSVSSTATGSNSNGLLSVFSEPNVQEKNFENMVLNTKRRFGSGASATLAGFAAAAAADQTCNEKNSDLVASSGFVAQTSPADDVNAVISSSSQPSSAHSFNDTTSAPPIKSGKSCNKSFRSTLIEDFSPNRKVSETTIVPKDFDTNLATMQNEPLSPRFNAKLQNKFRDSTSDKSKNVKEVVSKSSVSSKGSPCDDKNVDEGRAPAKGLSCRLCSFNSLSSAELQSHVSSTHKQDGFYKCEKCNYLGKNLSKLVEHIRIHTGERPFKCDQCSYAAKRKDNLGQHKAVRHDKRKNKSSSLYTVLDQINRESAATTAGTVGRSSPVNRKANVETNSSVSFSNRFPVFRDVRFYPKMDILSDYSYGKDKEKEKSPSAFAPLTPPFHTFPGMSAVHPTMFQYPFHTLPPMFHHSDLGTTMARSAGQNANNPGTYSVKARAALISP